MSNINEVVSECGYGKPIESFSKDELFEMWCSYNGYLGGCYYEIKSAIEEIYDINDLNNIALGNFPVDAITEPPIDPREKYIGKWITRSTDGGEYFKVVCLPTCYSDSVIVARANGWNVKGCDPSEFDRYFTDQMVWIINVDDIEDVRDEEPNKEVSEELSPWIACYREALKDGLCIDEAMEQADLLIGRGEFDDDDTIYSNDDICECENDREE